MNEADAFEIVRGAIWTIVVAAGPAVGAAMLVGIAIALFQALTQVQEMTLTFIPKILVILLMTAISAPLIGSQIYSFTSEVYGHIGDGF
ncbi:flagellar biosynthesis protein FliQ [Afifella sp. IM 167]|uniref:flagellar biosynthesis protein FliQ n=1 Tax=Afifella sp. IM 167 TaxID=2033586 RepID=UPI001CC9E067|nr:flagellar biosynthesis protein FliQ [Afifella sp. IM 167]MBZ8131803.1 flagellar biosynthetic protein FliQ [Afifella sp. IM 167]